ncbi:MAG TPA: phosphatase PAP2 family protein [Patescibacteria group bacterium]|nr:phosphatase PAP2 family protein [Patescibacteria group bacterium]
MIKKIHKKTREAHEFIKNSKIGLIVFSEIILGMLAVIGSIVVLVKIREEVFENDLNIFDNNILHFLYSIRTPFLNEIMIFITNLGGDFVVILGILIIAYLFIKNHNRAALIMGLVLIMSGILDTVLKDIVKRPRPQFHPLVTETGYSFPSGHAMNSFVFYAVLSYLVFYFTKSKKLAIIFAIVSMLLVLLIGISRVYLGVHYPSDVIAGYIAGFSWFMSLVLVERTLKFFKLFQEHAEVRK